MRYLIMKYVILSALILLLGKNLIGQTNGNNNIVGRVSYKSSQNTYVKFESTKNIQAGDTLFIAKENTLIPAFIVTNVSSTSCVGTSISPETINVSALIIAKNKKRDEIRTKVENVVKVEIDTTIEVKKEKPSEFKQKIYGSISANSYTNFSNTTAASANRYQYNLSLNAQNIANSKISVESYISFRYEKSDWKEVQANLFHALKIYSLSIKYDLDKNTQISFGRKINQKISSIGAVDGLQYEKKFNNYSLGVILGTRPNYADYNFDFSLPQFGAYISHTLKTTTGDMQNSFALIEQMNAMKTDRRFAYFQHSNSLIKNIYFFGTVEVDLYKKVTDKAQSTLSLSSTYLSLSYRMHRRLTFSASYDSRKNVVYYETYKNFINQILETEARQGGSFQTNYNPWGSLYLGIRAGYRFKNSNSAASKNMYAYATYGNIPFLNISATISANYIETSYISGKIYNLNLSRDFFQGKVYADCGYQLVDYAFSGSETKLGQNIGNISLSYRFLKNLSLSVNFEETLETQNHYGRLNFQIRKRF